MTSRTSFLLISMVLCTMIYVVSRGAPSHSLVISSAQAQVQLPTATPHMTCILPNSVVGPEWTLQGEISDGPGQTRVITIPSLHPRCQGVASNSNPMHALVDNQVRLKIWNRDKIQVFNNDVNLYLHHYELRSPDCTSTDGYELYPGHDGTYEVTINYQCCFSCYQTATPAPGTATPPIP